MEGEAQHLFFTDRPVDYQLYPRNGEGVAQVPVTGYTSDTPLAEIELYRENQLAGVYSVKNHKRKGKNNFSVTIPIKAEPANYHFYYRFKGDTVRYTLARNVVAGDVFVIAGQSNSVASGNSVRKEECNPFFRTLGTIRKNETYLPGDTLWGIANSHGCSYGKPFFNGYSAHLLHSLVLEQQGVPSAIINMGVGGSTIEQNLPDKDHPLDPGTIYGSGLYRIRKAGLQQAVTSVIWLQGESNQRRGYHTYQENFHTLLQAWKRDFPNLQHIYMSQINTGCGESETASLLREEQRQIAMKYPELKMISNVDLPLRPDDCHYTREVHDTLWNRFYRLLAKDHYNVPRTWLTSPNILKVFYGDPGQTTLILEFDQPVVCPVEEGKEYLSQLFLDENKDPLRTERIEQAKDDPCRIIFTLSSPATITHLTYGPDGFVKNDAGDPVRYGGPWIRNQNHIPALTFHRFEVTKE